MINVYTIISDVDNNDSYVYVVNHEKKVYVKYYISKYDTSIRYTDIVNILKTTGKEYSEETFTGRGPYQFLKDIMYYDYFDFDGKHHKYDKETDKFYIKEY